MKEKSVHHKEVQTILLPEAEKLKIYFQPSNTFQFALWEDLKGTQEL